MTRASISKLIQVNVDRETATKAEEIMKQIGVTPAVVINALYQEIASTEKIPLNLSLIPRKIPEERLNEALKKVPMKEIKTKQDLEGFFEED